MRRSSVAALVAALLDFAVWLRLASRLDAGDRRRRGLVVRPVPHHLGDALARGRVFFVEFVGTPEPSRAESWISAHGRQTTTRMIRDEGGRELLEVLEVSASR